ncbi:hypothetical protein J7E73_23800 [Paenibacillus albidus]|uniref:hypothetical protein n=1 Tax=Paenibacillus albidus TaxID=2041023 RepID=UPI001BE64127|nr:hypothetical protein [Paenibacillus albidus]MBT2292103.1 hypothetical protein [Paenibacillus albidus]
MSKGMSKSHEWLLGHPFFCRLGNYAMPKIVDILEASDEIGGATGLGSISGMGRTEKTLFCEKVCFPGEFGLRSRYIVRLSLE